jgi:hypothetical protein
MAELLRIKGADVGTKGEEVAVVYTWIGNVLLPHH